MKKLHTFDASRIGERLDADQVIVLAFVDDRVDITSWGYTDHHARQAKQWADKRFGDFVAGALRPPSNERVKKRCA